MFGNARAAGGLVYSSRSAQRHANLLLRFGVLTTSCRDVTKSTKKFLLGACVVALTLLVGVPASAQIMPAENDSPPILGSKPSLSSKSHDDTALLGAIGDSMKLLMIEHGFRVAFQEKTRRELTGPFFHDYARSVKWPTQWEDTDSWMVNYIGHPLHGAAAGRIWLDHGKYRSAPTGLSLSYWNSRARATAFSALYSLQFEFGPLSEASIGNVGMYPGTSGWVDHAVTPAGAFVVMVAEDALDHFFVAWAERHVSNTKARAALRMLFAPSRTLANVAQSEAPWYRPDRPIAH